MFEPITDSRLDLDLHPAREAVWPLPALNGRPPALVRAPNPARPSLDLAYARACPDELVAKYPPSSANGSASHFMPNLVPAFAVRDGVIAYAGKTGEVHMVIVDHRDGWATLYADLEHMFAVPTASRAPQRAARVRGGDVLGYVGARRPDALKCLRFELWKRDDHGLFNAVDPTQHMRAWLVLPWTDERLTPTVSAALGTAA